MLRYWCFMGFILLILGLGGPYQALGQDESPAETPDAVKISTKPTSAKDQLSKAIVSVADAKKKIDEFLKTRTLPQSEEQVKSYFNDLIDGMEDLVSRLSETSDFMDAINKLKLRYENNAGRSKKDAQTSSGSEREELEKSVKKNLAAAKSEENRKERLRKVRKDFEQQIIDLTQEEQSLLRKLRDEEAEEISKMLDKVETSINTALEDVDDLVKDSKNDQTGMPGN